MTNFILGAVSLYFLINITTLLLLVIGMWRERGRWRFRRILFILFFGLIGLFLSAFEDIF